MNSSKKIICIYIDVMERWDFFKRFIEPANKLNYEVIIVTNKLSVKILASKYQCLTIPLKDVSNFYSQEDIVSLSVLNHYHSKRDAKNINASVQNSLEIIFKKYKPDYFFIWNGTTTIAMAIVDFCQKYNIDTRFFEISNFNNKIFIDKEGTNARSYLYKNPHILDKLTDNIKIYEKWKSQWIETKLASANPKQTKNIKNIPWSYLIDIIGFIFLGYIREDKRNPLKVFAHKLTIGKKLQNISEDCINIPQSYIFFPMQVSDDSQIKLNSSIDNIQALKKALQIAKKDNLKLVVKLHPAEQDFKFIKNVISLANKHYFIICSKNSIELIKKSKKVITINSTVGLEAMILEKDVIVLGRAIYKEFDNERLRKYIVSYLIEMDYFNQENIDKSVFIKILNRVN